MCADYPFCVVSKVRIAQGLPANRNKFGLPRHHDRVCLTRIYNQANGHCFDSRLLCYACRVGDLKSVTTRTICRTIIVSNYGIAKLF